MKKPQVTLGNFVEELHGTVPEVDPIVAEHLDDFDELLIHLLMADLRRDSISRFAHDERVVPNKLLAFLDHCLTDGDYSVNNAVAVSFIEDAVGGPDEPTEFIETWPPAMQTELRKQREWWQKHFGS